MIWRILITVFVGISCFTCFLKNCNIFGKSNRGVILTTIYGIAWRAAVIVGAWMI